MLGRFLRSTSVQEIYFANQLILGPLLTIQLWVARRNGLAAEPESAGAQELSWRPLIFPIGAMLAMVIAPLQANLSFCGFLVAALIVQIMRKRLQRKSKG